MRNSENTACDRGSLCVGPNGNQRWGTLMFLCLSCVTASAAFVTVEFDARISGSNMEGWREGERMIGYFEYDPDLPPGRQTNSRPILAFGNPGAMNEFWWYDFTVYDNRLFVFNPFQDPVALDGISLRFDFMCCSPERYGYLSLTSSNTSLFTNTSLPRTIPPVERFDETRSIGITREDVQPYGTVSILIERLSVVPGSGQGRPVIFGVERTTGAVRFRFQTEASRAYAVQVTGNLTNPNWLTLTNIISAREPVVTAHEAAGLEQRFYRIRQD